MRNISAERAGKTVDDPAWLRHRWHDLRRTQAQIAAEAGCSVRTVRSRLREFGIARPVTVRSDADSVRRSRYDLLNDATWLTEQSQTKSIYAIAAEVGCDRRAVRCALLRHGIT